MATATYYLQQHLAGRVLDRVLDRQVLTLCFRKTARPGVIRVDVQDVQQESAVARVVFEVLCELDALPLSGERWPGDRGSVQL